MTDLGFELVSQACARWGWPAPEIVPSTGSTNDDLVGRGGHGLLRVALEQTAGQGRLGRRWLSAPGEGLTFSLRLDVPATVTAWGWIPLLAGVATAEAVSRRGARGIAVKWPNDVVAGGRKAAGILSVRDRSSAIIGIGINLAFSGGRPDPDAVSVAELGGDPDADLLLAACVDTLGGWWERFVAAGGDPVRSGLREAYLAQCVCVPAEVEVRAADRVWTGFAEDIDADGSLLVREGSAVHAVTAGDVSIRY